MSSQFYAQDHIKNLEALLRQERAILMATTKPEDRAVVEAKINTLEACIEFLCGYTNVERMQRNLNNMVARGILRGILHQEPTYIENNGAIFKLMGIKGENR